MVRPKIPPEGDHAFGPVEKTSPGDFPVAKGCVCSRSLPLNKPSGWIDSLINFFFPERCLFCSEILPFPYREPLCPACRERYRPGGRICPYCEGFFRKEPDCTCLAENSPLLGLFVIALYDPHWRRLIHDFKYRNRRAVLRPLAGWLAGEIVNSNYCKADLVVPVPLHPRREKERGYNQAALLARHTARVLQVPFCNLLARDMDTRSQTSVSRYERYENVRGAFKVLPGEYGGKSILLLDDVYSTGSTMKEAALALKGYGARVYGAAIAYNPNLKALQRSGFYAGLDNW